MLAKRPKTKRCKLKACRMEYTPIRPLQTVCSPSCALAMVNDRKEREEAARLKRERMEWRAKLEEAKPLSWWLAKTQRAVNALRREMDKGKPCYTCGTFKTVQWECGHYRSRGACSSARFDIERNLRTTCHFCNVELSGNLGIYRARLMEEIGAEAVLALEAMPKSRRWTRAECEEIERDAKQKLKALQSVSD